MLYVTLDFENNLTVYTFVDSKVNFGAIAENDLDKTKQNAPNTLLKIDNPPNFQIQVATDQLEKPLARTTLKSGFGDTLLFKHFVVMKKHHNLKSKRKQYMKMQYNMHDGIRCMLYTSAHEHGNQRVQIKTTGRPLRQGGSSGTTAPAAVFPPKKTGIQPCTLQLRSLWSTPFLNPIQELVEQLEMSDVIPTN